MARPTTKKRKAGKISIVEKGDLFGWRVTGDDGKPVKPRFGKVKVHSSMADVALELGVSRKVLQNYLKSMADRNKVGSRQAHRMESLSSRSHRGVRRTIKAKRDSVGGAGSGLAEDLG
jgi:hypothetical protein